MESLDHWRLCDELSVIDAALLIAGLDPATSFIGNSGFESDNPIYAAAKKALINAVRSNRLKALIRREMWARGYDESPDYEEWLVVGQDRKQYICKIEPDWQNTTILVDDLRDWLKGKGFKTGFFFPQTETEQPDYLDSNHSNYSQKLAAAIEAWLAVTQTPNSTKSKSVKQAIGIYLRSNAGRFGLIKEDGNPNESGIEEVAKVANWETKGGAPKTPY